jgi:hypothetical protein
MEHWSIEKKYHSSIHHSNLSRRSLPSAYRRPTRLGGVTLRGDEAGHSNTFMPPIEKMQANRMTILQPSHGLAMLSAPEVAIRLGASGIASLGGLPANES